MDLELQEVATLLQVSENELLEWVRDCKVPAYLMDERYRFNRPENEAWVMRHQGQGADPLKTSGSMRFNLFRAVNNGHVYHDIEGGRKLSVIRNTMKRVAPLLRLDAEVLTEMFMDRENLVPTAVGQGFAIPHA